MNADQPAPPAAAAWNPGLVELTVQMDLGSAIISLDELQSLAPGYVFALGRDPASPVIARVNGVAIGRGEIVRVGDGIGVRLTTVGHDGR